VPSLRTGNHIGLPLQILVTLNHGIRISNIVWRACRRYKPSMRLELGCFYIKDVRFAARTAIDDGVLSIDRAALVALLQQEPLFERVDIELAHPGESCCILRMLDALEPLASLAGLGRSALIVRPKSIPRRGKIPTGSCSRT